MGERKSHVKSRLGCSQCKARRVKCDEKHPSCGNCRRRQECCSYRNPEPSIASSPDANGTVPAANGLGSLPQLHLKQLELMHQFCTDTYTTLALMPQGPQVQQFEIPRLAFQHSFLLDTVFAITSLHLASLRPHEAPWRIADAATYQARAIAATRLRVTKFEATECRAMYFCSAQLGIIALAFRAVALEPPGTSSVSETLKQLSQLWRGTWSILLASRELVPPELYDVLFPAPDWAPATGSLTPPLNAFLATLNAKARGADPDAKDVILPPDPVVSMEEQSSTGYLIAIAKLEVLLQLCKPEPSRILAYLVEVPQVFWDLVHQRDPLACAIVLLYGTTYRVVEGHWWANSIRHQLTGELLPIVASGDPELAEIAMWVQNATTPTSAE
ncbi:hypothetical protein CERZMDRAFT_96489 [Cercospora zeae-maydis SCOH1-5]|uniref:Zn(2)-C6 fungal-type domain-containing protein n=1 Tax=Cercospora zeae-maydis SCOH1-5 TaxID=717836 RepID=A0A6A6FKC1_9PEZI|nr:hypothetical protein CERZMDRAFT_96489 [Cercospora zeae-maydis SCOH1-5]